ncbi:unnamed protein product [Brassica rapa subsp. trilocularis]
MNQKKTLVMILLNPQTVSSKSVTDQSFDQENRKRRHKSSNSQS